MTIKRRFWNSSQGHKQLQWITSKSVFLKLCAHLFLLKAKSWLKRWELKSWWSIQKHFRMPREANHYNCKKKDIKYLFKCFKHFIGQVICGHHRRDKNLVKVYVFCPNRFKGWSSITALPTTVETEILSYCTFLIHWKHQNKEHYP